MFWGIVAGLAAGALWGTVFVAPRLLASFSVSDITSARYFFYGVTSLGWLLALSWKTGSIQAIRWPRTSQWPAVLGMSLLGFIGYYLCLSAAILDSGSELPSLIVGTIPIWVMVLGKSNALRWASLWPGLLLTSAGIALLAGTQWSSLKHDLPGSPSLEFWRGVGWALCAMVLWTAFALLNVRWLRKNAGVGAEDWANWLGLATGMAAIFLWLTAGTPMASLQEQPDFWLFVGISLFLGVFPTWLGTYLWNVASQKLSASLCGQLIVSETLFALLYSYAWDARWPSLWQGGAIACFLAGIVWSIRAHQDPERDPGGH